MRQHTSFDLGPAAPSAILPRRGLLAALVGALLILPLPVLPAAEPVAAAAVGDALGTCDHERAQMLAAQAEARAALERMQRAEDELQRLSAEQQRLSAAESAAAVQLGQARDRVATLDTELGALRQQLARQQDALAEARGELSNRATAAQLLEGELAATQRERAALDERLAQGQREIDALQRERGTLSDQLAKEQAAARRVADALNEVTAARDRLHQELARSEADKAGLDAALRAVEKERAEARDRVAELDQANAALGDELGRARRSLEAAETRSTAADRALSDLRGGLPEAFGGTASLALVKDAAAQSAAALRRAHLELRRAPQDPALLAELDRLSERLRTQQLLVAGASAASGLYRLRAEDTLARVAARFYGDGGRWPQLYSANGHILDNPDRVIPGLTLVLP